MQYFTDMAAIQRQRSSLENRNRTLSDAALSDLLRGHEGSLAALAQPSTPSISEMMARM